MIRTCYPGHAMTPWRSESDVIVLRPVKGKKSWYGQVYQDNWYWPTHEFWAEHCQFHTPRCDLDYHLRTFTSNPEQEAEWGWVTEAKGIQVMTAEDFNEECNYFDNLRPLQESQTKALFWARNIPLVIGSVLLLGMIIAAFIGSLFAYGKLVGA